MKHTSRHGLRDKVGVGSLQTSEAVLVTSHFLSLSIDGAHCIISFLHLATLTVSLRYVLKRVGVRIRRVRYEVGHKSQSKSSVQQWDMFTVVAKGFANRLKVLVDCCLRCARSIENERE